MYIEFYTIYEKHSDITFIMEDTYKNGELVSEAVVGWHHGEPCEDTKRYIGKLKATFEW